MVYQHDFVIVISALHDITMYVTEQYWLEALDL